MIVKEKNTYNLQDFYFDLPEELIAQQPEKNRDESGLFVLNRARHEHTHRKFKNITDYLCSDDILVFNDVRVINARIFFKRETGGIVEVILTNRIDINHWMIITNRTKRLNPGEILSAVEDKNIRLKIIERNGDFLRIESSIPLDDESLKKIGNIPLPPYIKRNPTAEDIDRYQTVFAKKGEAAAAPTAGLHFTDELMSEIRSLGVQTVFLTLDVSWGTFQPVRDNDITLHQIHRENFFLPESTAEIINNGRKTGKRIIAVGTTSLRVLESTFKNGENISGAGETEIFIYPPYRVQSIDCLITNFHTPYSTLLMLVSAFAGYDKIMKAYDEAVKNRYRFFSYGDAMLII